MMSWETVGSHIMMWEAYCATYSFHYQIFFAQARDDTGYVEVEDSEGLGSLAKAKPQIEEIRDLESMPVPKRFQRLDKDNKLESVMQFNQAYERYVKGISLIRKRTPDAQKEHPLVDLDEYWRGISTPSDTPGESGAGATGNHDGATSDFAQGEGRLHGDESRDSRVEGAGGDDGGAATTEQSSAGEQQKSSEQGADVLDGASSSDVSASAGSRASSSESDVSASEEHEPTVDSLFAALDERNAACGHTIAPFTGAPKATGGYAYNFLDRSGAYAGLPELAKQAICPDVEALRGVHVYRDTRIQQEFLKDQKRENTRRADAAERAAEAAGEESGDEQEELEGVQRAASRGLRTSQKEFAEQAALNPVFGDKVMEDLYQQASAFRDLGFLKKVAFDEPVTRSTGGVVRDGVADKTLALAMQRRRLERDLGQGFVPKLADDFRVEGGGQESQGGAPAVGNAVSGSSSPWEASDERTQTVSFGTPALAVDAELNLNAFGTEESDAANTAAGIDQIMEKRANRKNDYEDLRRQFDAQLAREDGISENSESFPAEPVASSLNPPSAEEKRLQQQQVVQSLRGTTTPFRQGSWLQTSKQSSSRQSQTTNEEDSPPAASGMPSPSAHAAAVSASAVAGESISASDLAVFNADSPVSSGLFSNSSAQIKEPGRRLMFPALPDVEASYLQSKTLGKSVLVKKGATGNLKQLRHSDTLHDLYRGGAGATLQRVV